MKKILVFAALMMASGFASASTRYWQLNEAKNIDLPSETIYATLYGSATDDRNVGEGHTALQTVVYDGDNIGEFFAVEGISNESTKYFFVELSNGIPGVSAGERIAATSFVAYNDLNVYSGGMAAPSIYTGFTNYSTDVVPEPTSGMLVLLGALALGLKRKRA